MGLMDAADMDADKKGIFGEAVALTKRKREEIPSEAIVYGLCGLFQRRRRKA